LNYEVNGGFDISYSIIKNTERERGLDVATIVGLARYVSIVSLSETKYIFVAG